MMPLRRDRGCTTSVSCSTGAGVVVVSATFTSLPDSSCNSPPHPANAPGSTWLHCAGTGCPRIAHWPAPRSAPPAYRQVVAHPGRVTLLRLTQRFLGQFHAGTRHFHL